MKASKTTGRGSLLCSISSVSVRGVLSRCHPRLARRLGLSCRWASRPVPSWRLMRLIKQARRRGGTSPGSRLVVLPHYPCGGRAILGSRSVLRGVVIASSHIIPGKQAKRQEETRQGQDERGSSKRRRHGGLDDRIPGSYPDEQMRISKQDENGKRPRPISIISRPTGHISCPINQSIAPLTRQARRDAETRRWNNGRRRAGKTNTETTRRTMERKRTSPARRQASNETQDETPDETTTTRAKASKHSV